MLLLCFLSIDIYLNATSNDDSNKQCLEESGCSINALMQYFEDTNGDTLHILGDIDKPEDTFRLLTWISMKSYSEFTIIGSPSYLNMLSLKSNQQYKITLNESIITFENIFFRNINSPVLSANQGIITLKNICFEDTQENDDDIIKVGYSTSYFSNISIHKANIYHHSFFLFIETKIQIDSAFIYDFNLLSSDSFLFNFQRSCQVDITTINFIDSKSINIVIQLSDSILDIKNISVCNANITLSNYLNSQSKIDKMTVYESDFSFGKVINSYLSLENFNFFNAVSSRIMFEPDHSIFHFTSHVYYNSTFTTIIKTNGSLNTTVIFDNCIFHSTIGTASIFVFSNSDIKFHELNIKDLYIPNYCNFFNGKNTNTYVNSSLFNNIYSIGQSSFIFSVKYNYINIYNSSIYNIETQFLTAFLGVWEISDCLFVGCQCYIPSNQFLMTIIEASNFESGSLLNCFFEKCKVFLSVVYCFQGSNFIVENSTFSECIGTKSSSISAMTCEVKIKNSNFFKNRNPFPNGVAIFITCDVYIENCHFIHFQKSPIPVIRIINPTNLTFSNVIASEYKVFSILYHVQVPIYILNCVFENAFSDAFYISDFNKKIIFDRVNFSKVSMSFENEIKKSEQRFDAFSKKETKILKNENYFKTHEDNAFSQTRYLEYMKNLEPLSRNSTPFRVLPYTNSFPNCEFINDIEQILNTFKKRDQTLIMLSFFIMSLITIRYFLVEHLCRIVKKIYVIFMKRKNNKDLNNDENADGQEKQEKQQQQKQQEDEQPKLQSQTKNKNKYKNQKNKKKKQS